MGLWKRSEMPEGLMEESLPAFSQEFAAKWKKLRAAKPHVTV